MVRLALRSVSLAVICIGLLLVWWMYLLDTKEEWRAHDQVVRALLIAGDSAAIFLCLERVRWRIPFRSITPRALLMHLYGTRPSRVRRSWMTRIYDLLSRF